MSGRDQFTFSFEHRPALSGEDFLVSGCNRDAVAWLDRWPDWPAPALCRPCLMREREREREWRREKCEMTATGAHAGVWCGYACCGARQLANCPAGPVTAGYIPPAEGARHNAGGQDTERQPGFVAAGRSHVRVQYRGTFDTASDAVQQRPCSKSRIFACASCVWVCVGYMLVRAPTSSWLVGHAGMDCRCPVL